MDEELRKEYDFDLLCSPNCKPQKINIKNNIELTLDECYYGCLKKYRLFSGIYDVVVPKYSKPGDRIYLDNLGWNGGDLELEIINNKKNNKQEIKKILGYVIACCTLIAVVYGIEGVAYHSEEWNAFQDSHSARIQIYDYTGIWMGKGPAQLVDNNFFLEC